jgi:hypothetical protein
MAREVRRAMEGGYNTATPTKATNADESYGRASGVNGIPSWSV